MQIDIPAGGMRRERPSKRTRRESTREHMDEAQSTFRSASPPAPSFMGAAIQTYIDEGFRKVMEEMKAREDERWKQLVETLSRSFVSVSETLAQALSDIASLKHDVSYLQELITAHISSTIPALSSSDSPGEQLTTSPVHSPVHSPTPTEPLESSRSPSIAHSLTIDPQPPTFPSATESYSTDTSFAFIPLPTPAQITLPTPESETTLVIDHYTPVIPDPSITDPTIDQPTSDPILVHLATDPLTPVISFPGSPHSSTTDYAAIFHPASPPTLSADDKKGEKDPDL